MKKPVWLQTLLLSGLAIGAQKFAEAGHSGENPLLLAAIAGAVALEVAGHYLIHVAHAQRKDAERREHATRNHQVRRGMAAALRRALSKAPMPKADLYAALTKSWEEKLKLAVEDDDALERFFPAEQFAESHWSATNFYSPNSDQDSEALAAVLREWLIPESNLYDRWPQSEALEFARRALPFYQQAFADDLAEPDGLLSQAFTVKGINEIRAFTLRALPLLTQIAGKQGDHHAEVMKVLRETLDKLDAIAPPKLAAPPGASRGPSCDSSRAQNELTGYLSSLSEPEQVVWFFRQILENTMRQQRLALPSVDPDTPLPLTIRVDSQARIQVDEAMVRYIETMLDQGQNLDVTVDIDREAVVRVIPLPGAVYSRCRGTREMRLLITQIRSKGASTPDEQTFFVAFADVEKDVSDLESDLCSGLLMFLGNAAVREWLIGPTDVVSAMEGYGERVFAPYTSPRSSFEIELWLKGDPSRWKVLLYVDERYAAEFRRRTRGSPAGGYLDFSHLDLVKRVIPSIVYRAIRLRSGLDTWPVPDSVFDLENWLWAIRGSAWERTT